MFKKYLALNFLTKMVFYFLAARSGEMDGSYQIRIRKKPSQLQLGEWVEERISGFQKIS